jgi:hypothetical protein
MKRYGTVPGSLGMDRAVAERIFSAESDGGLEVQMPSQWVRFQSKALRQLKTVWKRSSETNR